jgi:hypothetical protein
MKQTLKSAGEPASGRPRFLEWLTKKMQIAQTPYGRVFWAHRCVYIAFKSDPKE